MVIPARTRLTGPRDEWTEPAAGAHPPVGAPAPPILQLQRVLGNHAVGRLLRGEQNMSRLATNEPGDTYEQEADRVADRVLAAPTQRAITSTAPHIQRLAAQPSGGIGVLPPSVGRTLARPGQALDHALRHDMEQRFGHDFSGVRVHTGTAAGQSAHDVNALAYTSGRHVVFATGRFAPGTPGGRRLIAHELAHVVQQSSRGVTRSGLTHDHSSAPPPARSPLVQRKPDERPSPASDSPAQEYEGELEAVRYAIGARSLGKLAEGTFLHRSKGWTATGLSDNAFFVGPFTSDMGNFVYVYRFARSDEKNNTYAFTRGTYLYGWGAPESPAAVRARLDQITGGTAVEFTTTGLVPRDPGTPAADKTKQAPSPGSGKSPAPSGQPPDTPPGLELTPQRLAWLKAGRENMKNQINALFDSIQELKADRISVWKQNAEIEDPKPLRTALEVAVVVVSAGMGSVVGKVLSYALAAELAQEFTKGAGKKATELIAAAIFQHAVAPAKEFLTETTRKALAQDKGSNTVTALASKGSLLNVYAEAMRLQSLSEENVQYSEFNKQVDAKYSDVALADLIETFQALYEKLKGEPGYFLRELTIGLIRLKDEVYVAEKAADYGGDVDRMLAQDPDIHETARRSGNLLLVPAGLVGRNQLGEWHSPTLNFAGFIGLSTQVNNAVLVELAGTPLKDLPITLGFRFWALNPFKGWGMGVLWTDVLVKVWFERRADGTIWVDLDEADDEGLEWLASYYLNTSKELSESEREKNAPQGARKVYEQIKNKPLTRAENFDIL